MAQVEILSHWSTLIENYQTSSLDFYNAVIVAMNRRSITDCQASQEEFHEGGIASAKRIYLRIRRQRIAYDICAAPYGSGFFFSSWMIKIHTSIGIWIFLGAVVASFILSGLTMAAIDGVLMDQIPLLRAVFRLLGPILFLAIGFAEFLMLILFLGHLINTERIPGEDSVLAIPILGALYARIYHPITYYKTDTALMFQQTVHNAMMETIDAITGTKGIRPLTELERKPVMKDFLGK
jgi:hypothetical protein